MIGKTVGNFRVTGLLGEGGMGAVYVAEHPTIGNKAAIKILHEEMSRRPEIADRFINEARAANAIPHPSIVKIHDFGALPDGRTYLAMELLEGQGLADRLRQARKLSLGETLPIVSQVAAALELAHKRNIVHRDLKPDNLFLVPDAEAPGGVRAKILDFGIAKLGDSLSASARTRTGALIGTPRYMSPEQCRGAGSVDWRSDIYSLGVIVYQMLCGVPPFDAEGEGELIHLHIAATPPSPRSRNPELPAQVENALVRALAKRPEDRQQSMSAFIQELSGAGRVPTAVMPAVGDAAAPGAGGTRVMEPSAPADGTQLLDGGRASSAPSGAAQGGTQLLDPAGGPRPADTTISGSPREVDTAAVAPPKRRGIAAYAIGGAVAAAALVVFAIVRSGGEHTNTPPAPAPERTGPPATAAPVPPPAPAAPAPPPREVAPVSLRIDSRPAGANVVGPDGTVLGVTPFESTTPAQPGTRALRIEKPGFKPARIDVPLDRSFQTSVPLDKARDKRGPRPKEEPVEL